MGELTFTEAMETVAKFFEAVGAVVLLVGLALSAGLAIRSLTRTRDPQVAYRVLRRSFGGAIILGVEVLVAADLVRTVAIAPTIENAVSLAIIVLIRTVLSFSLETEIEGVVPWRRAATSGASHIAQAARQSGAST